MLWQLKISSVACWLIILARYFFQPCWAKVELTEIYPRPSQGDEWVELHNPSPTMATLQNWQLWDELSQPSLIYSFTTETIAPQGWLIVPINRKLNDSGDGVTLKDSTGLTIDFTHYDMVPTTDLSWAKLDENWVFTTTSPGLANPTPTPTLAPTSTPTPIPTTTLTPTSTSTPTVTPTPLPVATVAPTVINPLPTSPLPIAASTVKLRKSMAKLVKPTLQPSSATTLTALTAPPTPTTSTAAPLLPSQTTSRPPPQSFIKMVPWITAIMVSLTLSNAITCGFFVCRFFTNYVPRPSFTSHHLARIPPLG